MVDILTRILSLAGNNGCIKKVGVFSWPNDIINLHYVDDTLLVPNDARSLLSLKFLFYEFEMMTGLKINFHKPFVYNLSGSEDMGTRATSVLNCNLGLCLSLILGFQSNRPLKGKIGNHSLSGLKKDLQL